MVKNPNWQEADQLAIYKRGREVELRATEKQLLLAVRAGLEPGASGLQVRRPGLDKFCRQNFEQNKRLLGQAFCRQNKAFSSRI